MVVYLDRLLREPMEHDEEEYLDDCDDQDRFQSRNIYTKLLPNAEDINEEADAKFNYIKTNLPRCIQTNEIK